MIKCYHISIYIYYVYIYIKTYEYMNYFVYIYYKHNFQLLFKYIVSINPYLHKYIYIGKEKKLSIKNIN